MDSFIDGRRGCDSEGNPVFVLPIEFTHDKEDRIVRSGAHVRLLRPDQALGAGAYACNVSAVCGLVKFLNSGAQGERVIPAWRAAVFRHKRADKPVQTRAQEIDGLASQNREPDWNRARALYYEGVGKAIVLELSEHGVCARISDEGIGLEFELLDYLVGPLNLGPAAVE